MSPFWLKLLPAFIRRKIELRGNLINVISNTVWLFSGRLLRILSAFLIGIWMARYLGPEQYGLLNYAIAFVGIFSVIANLGLNSITVRELVKDSKDADAIMGTAIALQIAGGLVAVISAILLVRYLREDNPQAIYAVAILSITMILRASDVIKYWFESLVKTKYTVIVESTILLIASLARVLLIIYNAPLLGFVWLMLLETAFIAAGLFWIYSKQGWGLSHWQVSKDRAKRLIYESWPVIVGGVAFLIYTRIDQLMIGQILGDREVGVYSAAVRIAEAWYFVPVAIVASVFPTAIKKKMANEDDYVHFLNVLHEATLLIAFLVVIPVALLSEWIIDLLYGDAYKDAGTVLAIYAWSGLFYVIGMTSNIWFVIEKKLVISTYRTLIGAAINIGLNLIMIPYYGIQGAAWSTLVAMILASVLLNAVTKSSREIFMVQINSFRFKSLMSYVR